MRISAMEEYGLRALICLARKVETSGNLDATLTIPEVAESEGLSVPYASKIMRKLRQGGLVKADRGRSGGYSLTKIAEQITLLETLEALGGPMMAEDHCQKYPGVLDNCIHEADCTIRGAFVGFKVYLQRILSATTLSDLTSHEQNTRFRIDQSAESLMTSQNTFSGNQNSQA